MSTDAERVRRLIDSGLLVEAVELPPNHCRKTQLIYDIEEALSEFDDDMNCAHFVVRVRRSGKPIEFPAAAPSGTAAATGEAAAEAVTVEQMVTETLAISRELSENRAADADSKEQEEHDPGFLLESARALEENGEYRLARTIYRNLVKRGAVIAASLAGIARTFEAENLVDAAIRHYEEAIAYLSEASFYRSLSALQVRSGRDKDACDTLTRALGIPGLDDIQRFEFHKSLGNCYTRLGEHAKAEHHFLQAFELNSDSDALQVNVGSLALQKGDAETARKHFDRALELNSRSDRALCGLGMAALMGNDAKSAHGFFVECLKLDPANIEALFNLAKCAYELRSFAEAARFLGDYVQTGAPNTNVLYTYAGILYHQGEYRAAQAQLERILMADAQHAAARELAGLVTAKLGA